MDEYIFGSTHLRNKIDQELVQFWENPENAFVFLLMLQKNQGRKRWMFVLNGFADDAILIWNGL